MIKIVTLLGSVRPGNYTGKALALVHDELRQDSDVELTAFNPENLRLSMPGINTPDSDSKQIADTIKTATGVILATPEYHGTFSSVTKLLIENMGFPSALSSKPVSLLGVAAGQIGAIKSLEHLRGVCSHVGAIVLPGAVSVPNVQSVFDAQGNCLDEKIEKRIRRVATNLLDYIRQNLCPRIALEQMVRESSTV